MGLNWCTGNPSEKAEAFFLAINPPGQSQAGVAATDKEFPVVIDHLIEINTLWILQNCKMFTETKDPHKDGLAHTA